MGEERFSTYLYTAVRSQRDIFYKKANQNGALSFDISGNGCRREMEIGQSEIKRQMEIRKGAERCIR